MKKPKILLFSMAVSLFFSLPSGIYAAETESLDFSAPESQMTETISEIETAESNNEPASIESSVTTESEPESIEPSENTKPNPADSINFENQQIYNFVKRMYEIVLERSPDPTGLSEWYDALASGRNTGADIMEGFFFSKEYQNKKLSNDEYIHHLYRALFNREADKEGFSTWTNAFSDGVSRRFVCHGFLGSDEYREMCASYNIVPGDITLTENRDQNINITRFVSHFYKLCLGRTGDPEGLNNWTGNLLNHISDGAAIAEGFIFSDEFQAKNLTDDEFIEVMYQTILGRPSDPAGKESWLKCFEDGVSKHYILSGFIHSDEFNQFCNTYGIERGNITLNEYRDQNRELTAYITHLYTSCLNQNPTADELNNWADDLLNHRVIGHELASAFFTCDGYVKQDTDDTTYIKDLYRVLLDREAGTDDINNWLSILSTSSREEVLKQFTQSTEFHDICIKLGILFVRDGWVQEGDNWFYYENSQRKQGWFSENGQRYYLNPANNGAREVGWEYVDGYKLYFNNDGQLVQDVEYLIGQQDSYFIKVYKWGNYLIVFAKDGDNGYTIPVKAMINSCGNNTPTGNYRTSNKYRWLTMVGGSKAQWCTQILGDYLFHSVPYRTDSNDTLYTDLMYNYLGTTQSLGCIRLRAGDAKWIYDNCGYNTLVNIDPNVDSGPFDKPQFTPLPSWHTWDPTDPTARYLCQQHGCH